MKDIVKEYWQLAAAIFFIVLAILVMCCSCSSVKQTEYVTKTEYVHDTTKEYVHDTVMTTVVKTDSVDRLVEKTVYIDSNGNLHEKEIEKLTHYIYDSQEKYQAVNKMLEQRISELNEQLEQKKEARVVEKKVYVWWPLWVAIGLIVVAVAAVVVFEKVMNKMAEAEGE